jgi:signal transduction histidine kinase
MVCSSSGTSIGFSRNADAPGIVRSSSWSAKPVITITGSNGYSALTRPNMSQPSWMGRLRSSTSKSAFPKAASAESPSGAAVTLKPPSVKIFRSDSRTELSSSTIKIRLVIILFIFGPFIRELPAILLAQTMPTTGDAGILIISECLRIMNGNKNIMTGTNHSSGGFTRITRLVPQVKVRVLGFAIVVLCGTILLSWITHSLWTQLDRLQTDYAAVKSESFYLGVHLRGALRDLNDKLLQFGISQDPTFRDAFLNDSAELKDWIKTNQVQLAHTANLQLLKSTEVSKQLTILNQIMAMYSSYLTNATALVSVTNVPVSPGSFEGTYKRVREISSGMFPLCDDLVTSQREGFSEFLHGTQETLANHEQLLMVCSAMILGLTVLLAIMVYRGMIAPLQIGLTESRSIIERQEKLASLGILASGVAHEIRNPLTAIKFRLFSLRKALPAVSQNEDASVIGNEINRLEGIVHDFLQFARPSEPKLDKTEANRILEDVCTLLSPQLRGMAIELRLEARESERILVYADAPQVKQVMINLIQNSAESIGRNGTIALRVRREMTELDGRDRPAAVLVVEDNGQGIPPEVEARLFDPFFTTKEEGTGLGLAISARIVEKHGGLLRYETELNRGTTFEVVLPAVEQNASEHITD